ncbi:MAG: outer membrane beta-barrel protein [Bacteroidetes bacterium]|nr:outer membrane beta-barrel protein [Bacteroidota bacterium]
MKQFAVCMATGMLAAITVYAQTGRKDSAAGAVAEKSNRMRDTVKLKEVIVRPRGINYMEQKIDRTIIDVSALPSNTGGSAMDILNTLPGVQVDENNGISLRGHEGVVVYIDDKPTRLSGDALVNFLKSLPSSQLDKVEIITNPPAGYEAEGTAGIINIRTKKIKGQDFNGNLSLKCGMGRYYKSGNSINLNYRKNKLSVFTDISYSAAKNDFHLLRQRDYHYPVAGGSYHIDQTIHEISPIQGLNYRMSADYDFNKRTSVGLSLTGSSNPYAEAGSYSSAYSSVGPAADSVIYSASNFNQSAHRNGINFSMHRLLNSHGRTLTINMDYLRHRTGAEQTLESNTYLPTDSLAGTYILISSTPSLADIYGIRADYADSLAGRIKMELGVQSVWSVRRNSGGFYNKTGNVIYPNQELDNSFRYRENISAAYISLGQTFPHISWQAGLRAEHTYAHALSFDSPLHPDTAFTLGYINLFPTFYLLYKPDTNKNHQFIFSAGRRISRPGYQSLNPSKFFFDRSTSIAGNSLLQPEYSNHFELSYSIGSPLTVTLLYDDVRSAIVTVYRQQGNVYISVPVNLHREGDAGINASSTMRITGWWTINLYGELTRRTFTGSLFDGESYLNRHKYMLVVSGSQQFKSKNGWTADISGEYAGARQYAQSLRRPNWQLNAGLQKKLGAKTTISIAARDIFHSWRSQRTVTIPYASIYYDYRNDSQQLGVTLSHRFGKAAGQRVRKTAIQSESERL